MFNFGWIIKGTNGDDALAGTPFADILYGYDGDDSFLASAGADRYHGGSGYDQLSYRKSPDAVTIDLERNATGQGGYAEGDTYDSIEKIEGSNYGDTIRGDNRRNVIDGGRGKDVLDGRGGRDQISGGDGADIIYGGTGNDFLRGDDGNDQLHGGDDGDQLLGGNGNDRLFGDAGNDRLNGGNGADTIDGGQGFDVVIYGDGVAVDLISGIGVGADAERDSISNVEGIRAGSGSVLFGDNRDNIFEVQTTGTTADGRGGDDSFDSLAENNVLDGGTGTDTVNYGSVNATEIGDFGVYVDLNTGTAQNLAYPNRAPDQLSRIENVFGSRKNDTIFGDANDNYLKGFEGDDVLNGGRGDDILEGGSGADIYQFTNGRNDNDDDVVIGFRNLVDKIDFSDIANRIDDYDEFRDRSQQVGNDTVIDTGAGTITLINVSRNSLSDSDFIF